MRRASSLLLMILFPVLSILNNNHCLAPAYLENVTAGLSCEDEEFIRAFDDDFSHRLQRTGCPGAAVAIVRNDQVIFLKGFGTRRYGTSDSVDTETVFRIGSLSKGFAGLLTSMLVEEGCLNWEDPVQGIIPEFDLKDHAQAARITIRHLLSHSTGLQRHAYTDLTERGLSLDRIIPEFSNLDVYGREGKYYAYQNTAFSFIEEIILRKTGKTYHDLLVEKIFRPAGMGQASATFQEIAASGNVARPHVGNFRNKCRSARLNKKYYNAISAGGVNASIKDMAKWLRILLGNRPDLISPMGLDEIFTPVVKNPDRSTFYRWGGVESNYYGIGWRIVNWLEHALIYHSGSVNDYRSEIAIDRENRIGICILFNSNTPFGSDVVPDFFRQYYRHLERETSPAEAITMSKDRKVEIRS